MTAKSRYDYLSSERTQFLDEAEQASELTLPYLILKDQYTNGDEASSYTLAECWCKMFSDISCKINASNAPCTNQLLQVTGR